MNKYIHILDADGKRITSIVDNMIEPIGETALREKAKERYPDAAQYIYGDDAMLDAFLTGKVYVDGQFENPPVVEYIPTKAEKIAYIKKYYDALFATLDQALVRRRLINGDITDLQEQFKRINLEMLAKIKAVK